MNKRDHCAKKLIPMIASKLKHPKLSPTKIMDNSEYIANAIYNKLGDNSLPADVDNALIEVITACGIGQRNVLGVDCSRLTTENFKSGMNKNMRNMKSGTPGEKSRLMTVIVILVAIAILVFAVMMLKKIRS
jgi:hypothetical protein